MSPILFAIPIVAVLLIFVFAMPVMKKKAAEAGRAMDSIRNSKIHLSMAAGILENVNGHPAASFNKAGTIYGIDLDGRIDVEFTPYFENAGTTYKSKSTMHVEFDAEAGKSYDMVVLPKEPKDMTDVLDVREISSREIIFKTKFYIVTKDITNTQGARAMRGVM